MYISLGCCYYLIMENKTGKRFDAKLSRTFNNILDILNIKGKKVLDLGCGFGEFLVHFGKDSLGITTTLEEVEYGKDNNIRILKGNAELIEKLELKESFDVIWANNLFEHLLSPHLFLVKLRGVSREDTLLVLGVPVLPFIPALMKLSKWRGALATPHINFFTKKSLELTVERAGWEISHSRPFFFRNYFLDSIISGFMPHIYIVARCNKEYAYPDKKIKEWKDDPHYKDVLDFMKNTN